MNELADYFRAQAEWRDSKAEEYPEDARNEQSAAALRSLAEFIESGEDGGLAGALEPHLSEGFSLGGEEAQREVARYGFGHSTSRWTHAEFLEGLLDTCLKDAYAFISGGASPDDPTGTLYGFEIEAAQDEVWLPPTYWRRRAKATESELELWVREAGAEAELREEQGTA